MILTNQHIRKFLNMDDGDLKFDIYQVDAINSPSATSARNTLLFISMPDMDLVYFDNLRRNCVYLIDESYPEFKSECNDFIRVKNPKYKFCLIVEHYDLQSTLQRDFLHVNHQKNRYLGFIYCNEYILGEHVHVDPGVIVGGTDFSPVISDDGSLLQFPQLGGVSIGNNVVIKYNTMIGKGTFGLTSIGDSTMIDFGCQVGHNCQIGSNCIIAAGTIIGGSTEIGNHTVIGIGAKIRNGLKIGEGVSIGMGSVVIHDVPDGVTVVGNPARIIDHEPIFSERGLI